MSIKVSIAADQQPIHPISSLPYTAKLPCLLSGSFYRFTKHSNAFYAIGKIAKNGWRNAFDVAMPNTEEEWLQTAPVPTHFCFVYTGPFFIRCDHGCSHFTGSHATTGECYPSDENFRPGRVFRRCERQVQQSGFVFVWAGVGEDALDTAHGSLVEIGIAHALRKPILFAHHPQANLRDFWFAVETASAVVCADRPLTALEMLGADLDRAARRLR